MLFYLLVFVGLFLILYGVLPHIIGSKIKDENKEKKVFWFSAVATFLLFLVRAVPNLFGILLSFLPFFLEYKNRNKKNTVDLKNIGEQMTEEEAYEILGLDKNANEDEIKFAFKNLISKNHPDKGGSKYFTNKLITARDVLLKKYGGKNE